MSPREATALYILAHGLLHNAQPQKAATLLEALDALRPDDTRTLLALATAHLRNGTAHRALQALERAARAADAPPTTDLLKAQALAMLGRRREAKAAIETFLAHRRVIPRAASLPD